MTALWVVLLRHSVVIHVRLIVCRCRCRCHTIITVNEPLTHSDVISIEASINQSINQSISQLVSQSVSHNKTENNQNKRTSEQSRKRHPRKMDNPSDVHVVYTMSGCSDACSVNVWTASLFSFNEFDYNERARFRKCPKYCDQSVCMSVDLFACARVLKTRHTRTSPNFLYMLPCGRGRGPVLLWRHCNT